MGSRTGVTRKRLREPPLRRLRALDVGVGASCSLQRVQSVADAKLRDTGIVEFEERGGWTRAPPLIARRVTLELDLVGSGSVVSVERPKPADTEPHPTCPNCGNV